MYDAEALKDTDYVTDNEWIMMKEWNKVEENGSELANVSDTVNVCVGQGEHSTITDPLDMFKPKMSNLHMYPKS